MMQQISSLTILLIILLARNSNSQKTYPSKVSYSAKRLYEMRLDLEPTSVRLLLDPRRSSGVTRLFDLVLMASNPRSEVRRIADATMRVNEPQRMANQLTVTDYTTIQTPNSVGTLPANTIDSQPDYVWWIASGRFGSGSDLATNTGGVYLINLAADTWEPQPIYSQPRSGFTHVEWMDMDLDGKKDCITVLGRLNRASLMWLSQPRSGSGQWTPHQISNSTVDVGGTDFKVMEVRMPRGLGTRQLIVVAGRRTARLTGYWVDDSDNDWTQVTKIRSTLIDHSKAFVNVEIVDLNGDGTKDVLTSVSAFGGNPGHVLAYEVPKSGLGSGEWRKRVLHVMVPSYSNYRTLTPGPAYPFFVSSQFKQEEYKPHILVSGADDGKVYVLSPDSWSPFIWDYNIEEIYYGDPSVGVPAVHDVDGDGNAEIFIPAGESVHVMRYQPSSAPSTFQSHHLIIFSTVLTSLLFN